MGRMFAGLLIVAIGTFFGLKLIRYGKKQGQSEPKIVGWIFMPIFWFVGVVFWLLPGLASLTVNRLWFDSLDYSQVFWKILGVRWSLFLGFGALAAAFLVVNVLVARSISSAVPETDQGFGPEDLTKHQIISIVGWAMAGVILIFSLIFGGIIMSHWKEILLWKNQVPFGKSDPIFLKDIGFYVFSLPIYGLFSQWVRGLLWLTLILVFGSYICYYSLAREINGSDERRVLGRMITHLLVLWLPLFAVSFYRSKLRIWQLVHSDKGAVFGAGYTDVHARIGCFQVFMFVAVILALAVIVSIVIRSARRLKGKLIMLGSIFVAWGLFYVIIVGIVPGLYQYFVVRPNELAKETEYVAYNIHGTREAYRLDKIQESERVTALAGFEEIKQNQAVLDNVRVWDWRALLDTLRQMQEIRLYYEFSDVDIDRYWIGGKYSQVMLAAREFAANQIPEQAQTWVNQCLKYTHGYGLCLNRVNEFISGGMPNLLIRNIPPVSQYPEIAITRPEIYYGELTKDYVFVGTKEDEFDYPLGDENAYARYEGTGGVRLGSGLRRLAFMLDFSSLKVILSSYLTSESRAMFHREINARMERIAPFLLYEPDAYIVIGKSGRLWWISDAYTLSAAYPYSEPYKGRIGAFHGINYLRNSVKVVVDAYNGNVSFFVCDIEDPILKAYQRMFPGLFKDIEEMPDGLIEHLRYPDQLLTAQAEMFAAYHMTNPQTFYTKEDFWALPNEVYMGSAQPMLPYFVITQLPGEEGQEFINMLPLTPARKQNMIAWLCDRSDGEHYGETIVFRLPKGEIVLGPEQIEARIDQQEEISSQLTLWDQKGSQVIRGNLLVIPLKDSLFYVEPVYLQAENAKMPELKRVVVAAGDSVSWGTTLTQALERISVGVDTSTEASVAGERGLADVIASADRQFREYLRLTGEGKTVEAGQALQHLGQELEELQEMQKQ